MKSLLGDFNAKLREENIFEPTIGNESLHQDSNHNGVTIVKLATSKKSSSRSEVFTGTPGSLIMGRLTTRLITY
jgi:hypothetical protein